MWKKKLPSKNGWYWTYSRGKHGWTVGPCLVSTLGPYGVETHPTFDKKGKAVYDIVVNVVGMGFFPIHKGHSEAEARRVFKFKELQFWSEPMTVPPSPAARKKRKVKA